MRESLEKLLQSYIDSYLNNLDPTNRSQQLLSDMGSPDNYGVGKEDADENDPNKQRLMRDEDGKHQDHDQHDQEQDQVEDQDQDHDQEIYENQPGQEQ